MDVMFRTSVAYAFQDGTPFTRNDVRALINLFENNPIEVSISAKTVSSSVIGYMISILFIYHSIC